jgi:hypothetical protein
MNELEGMKRSRRKEGMKRSKMKEGRGFGGRIEMNGWAWATGWGNC